jgi:hypothetical protein
MLDKIPMVAVVIVAVNYEAATHSRSACRRESMSCFMPAANNLLIARLTNLSNFKLIKEIIVKNSRQTRRLYFRPEKNLTQNS